MRWEFDEESGLVSRWIELRVFDYVVGDVCKERSYDRARYQGERVPVKIGARSRETSWWKGRRCRCSSCCSLRLRLNRSPTSTGENLINGNP